MFLSSGEGKEWRWGEDRRVKPRRAEDQRDL
jgi:hypothetical protein